MKLTGAKATLNGESCARRKFCKFHEFSPFFAKVYPANYFWQFTKVSPSGIIKCLKTYQTVSVFKATDISVL